MYNVCFREWWFINGKKSKKDNLFLCLKGLLSEFALDVYNLSIVKCNNRFIIFDVKEKKSFLKRSFVDVDIEKFCEGMLPVAEKKEEE